MANQEKVYKLKTKSFRQSPNFRTTELNFILDFSDEVDYKQVHTVRPKVALVHTPLITAESRKSAIPT